MYVQRDTNGAIIGLYRQLQPFADQKLPDDDPAVIAFLNPPLVITVSRRQFFQQAAVSGIITQDEALAAVTTGTLPALILSFIAALPAGQQFATKMLFSSEEFQRTSPLANAFGETLGMTPDQIDAFFVAAAAL